MNQLIVVAFDHFDDARDTMKSLRELEGQGRIRFEDTAVIEREPDGTAHVKNEVSGTTETATVIGALLGGLLAWVLPVAGIALGAAIGAFIGATFRTGVEPDFVEDVKKTLRPGRSALFLVIKESQVDAVVAALRPFKGELLQTTVDTDTEEALKQALD